MPNIFLPMSFSHESNVMESLTQFMSYAIKLTSKKVLNILYIGTAKDDWLDNLFFKLFMLGNFGFYNNYRVLPEALLSGKDADKATLENLITQQDIIFVGGGNTNNMLKKWKSAGLIEIFTKLSNNDLLPIMAGVSAGGMFPFQAGLTDSWEPYYATLSGINLLKGSFCPHLESSEVRQFKHEPKTGATTISDEKMDRKKAFITAAENNHLPYPCYGLPDDCMMVFKDGKLTGTYSVLASKKVLCFKSNQERNVIYTTVLTSQNVKDEAVWINPEAATIERPRCAIL